MAQNPDRTKRPRRKRRRDGDEEDHESKRQKSIQHDATPRGANTQKKVHGVQKTVPTSVKLGAVLFNGTGVRSEVASGRRGLQHQDWTISNPVGGRILDIDPILSEDEKYLILAYSASIQVFTTDDSLLVRRFPFPLSRKGSRLRIMAMCQSRVRPNFVWVALGNGFVYQLDWTAAHNPKHPPNFFCTETKTCLSMAVLSMSVEGEQKDVLIVAEAHTNKVLGLHAYTGTGPERASRPIAKLTGLSSGPPTVETSQQGMVITGALGSQVFVTSLRGVDGKPLNDWVFDFFVFDTDDIICSLDVRVSEKNHQASAASEPTVDVIAGGARGKIFLYGDVLTSLSKRGSRKDIVRARQYHWHRRAVHALKWSRDGNYMISGGSENVLVLWQMDTSKKDFLPHLSSSIENIVVSAAGSSYVVHLDDNSAMVISTAEMKPITYIAGLQSLVSDSTPSKDMLVKRVWEARQSLATPTPSAINPSDPTKLHLCVGNGQQASVATELPSTPWMQTFDLASFRCESRQALARTHPTDVNITTQGHPITEPRVVHMKFSCDGKWLATVDEWEPTARDAHEASESAREQFVRQRREVYLKFWQASPGQGGGPFELVSRINAPHSTSTGAEVMFDLVPALGATKFATVGSDHVVRLWKPVSREQDGIRVKDAKGRDMHKWVCEVTIDLGGVSDRGAVLSPPRAPSNCAPTGSLAFSEDDSTLFVAYGSENDGSGGTIHVLDAHSGHVRHTLQGLWSGSFCRMVSLSSFLVIVSRDLVSYNVVAGEIQYGVDLPSQALTNTASQRFVQIAADRTTGCFAITLPHGNASDIGIFRPESSLKVFMHTLSTAVTSIANAPNTAGFLLVDDSAQILTVSAVADQGAFQVLPALEDVNLNKVTDEDGKTQTRIEIREDENDSGDEADAAAVDEDAEMELDDEDGAQAAVVSREGLSSIFDAAPAFALPPIEDLFYQVAGMVGQKPVEL